MTQLSQQISSKYRWVSSKLPEWKTSDQRTRNNIFGFVLFLPTFLVLAGLVLFPVLYVIYLSMLEISIFETSGTFVGVQNYIEMISESSFQAAFGRGVIYAFFAVMFQLFLGITLGLLINKSFRGVTLVRTIAIFPYLVPIIAVVIMWQWILNPVYGAVNLWGVELGLINESIAFFENGDLALPSVIVFGSWKYQAIVTLVILARLQAIPGSLYEQAKVSGASALQRFFYITLPNLRSAILLMILLRGIWQFNQFAVIWLFTRGGPYGTTTTLPVYVYKKSFISYELGAGAAGTMVLFILLAIASVFYFWYFQPSEEIETQR